MIRELYALTKHLKQKECPFWPFVFKVSKLIVNVFYPIKAAITKPIGSSDESPLVVSLTSFPDRIGTVWLTISSLLNQTMKPKKVILWLANEQFPDHKLPKNIKRLCKYGLEVKWCEDLKPHKKYYFTMLEYPNSVVVTADDDIFYPENHLEQLWDGHTRCPDAVVCTWSHVIEMEKKVCKPYRTWKNIEISIPSFRLIPIGCNGILYPPNSMDSTLFDIELLKKYSLYTDDLWLKCMQLRKGTKAYNCCNHPLIYFDNIMCKKSGLWHKNTSDEGRNDAVWKLLMQVFPECNRLLYEEYKTLGATMKGTHNNGY